jgi:ParB family chromosome partitioning protein
MTSADSGHSPIHGLGRGLGALLPSSGEAVQHVDIDLVAPNPEQPRRQFDPQALEELAESIRQHGILQPLIVTRDVSSAGGVSYRLIAGERRLQAARRAGLARVPVIVRDAQDIQRLELALVENLQRSDLTPLEEAEAFRRLVDEFGLTQEEVGRRLGRGRVAVANALRLLGLSPTIRASLAAGEISAGHARALLGAELEEDRLRILGLIRTRGLSVRETEALVRALRAEPPRPRPQPPASTDDERNAIEERLRTALATQVELRPGRRGGSIVIHYYDEGDLRELLAVLLRGRGPVAGAGT